MIHAKRTIYYNKINLNLQQKNEKEDGEMKKKETIEIAIAPGKTMKFPNDETPVAPEDKIDGETVFIAIAPGVAMEFPVLDFSGEE